MKVTILGCGTSGGVPRIGGEWGVCDPNEPRNRRSRGSILVADADTTILVDTSPDMRTQLLDAGIGTVDGVIYTHEHADQCHGIDDLRVLGLNNAGYAQIDVYALPHALAVLNRRFDYIFEALPGSGYPSVANGHEIDGAFGIGDIAIQPFVQTHGAIDSLGLRFGDIAYSNDVNALSEQAFALLEGVSVWIVDALRYKPHPTHAHLAQTLEWIARVKPRRAILTNMHVDLDYRTLCETLPEGVEPGYDGMVIEV